MSPCVMRLFIIALFFSLHKGWSTRLSLSCTWTATTCRTSGCCLL
uniref:Uncharacterized protein n=1 Tax=Arundo donax TaxID=35708 RepID=A0A0A8ZE10_ARUDO